MRILSYNIQAAIHSNSYFSYSYQWPRQLLPTPAKKRNLERIAEFLRDFDVVCLQEIELGGLRNGFKSQHAQLLELTDFPYDAVQTNRRVGQLSLHGNLILSRYPLNIILDSPLPSQIKGRGVLATSIDLNAQDTLIIANTHLSLGKLDQHRQLRFIRTRLQHHDNILICGDLNCRPDSSALRVLTEHGYRLLGRQQASFPSWKPQKALDHALFNSRLAADAQILPFRASDHLPLAITIHHE